MSGRLLLVLIFIGLLVGGGVFTAQRFEGTPPMVQVPPEIGPLGEAGGILRFAVSDAQSGIRAVQVMLLQGERSFSLLDELYPSDLLGGATREELTFEITLDPKELELESGEAALYIGVRDGSLRDGLSGNQREERIEVRVDLDPPHIFPKSGLTYIRQGGSGAVRYRISEPVKLDGVRVGERFFQGSPQPGGNAGDRIALFAVPAGEEGNLTPQLVAIDTAGNRGIASWPVRVSRRPLTEVIINLPAPFLQEKVPALAREVGVSTTDPVEAFVEINTEVRARNEQQIREQLVHTPTPLWEGPFQQWPGSAVMSKFGERRRYRVGSSYISDAVHSGYDLAATAASVVPASNRGKVIFAGPLGIYGNCVILDHGLGLSSLYGHLSRIDVAPGQLLEKGSPLGLSGASGLAGGDHLHFSVLVGDTYVSPLEWWDRSWMDSHIFPALYPSP